SGATAVPVASGPALDSGREPPPGTAAGASVYPSGLLLMTSRSSRAPARRTARNLATAERSIRAAPVAPSWVRRDRGRSTSARPDFPSSLPPIAARDTGSTSSSLSSSLVPRVVGSLVIVVLVRRDHRQHHRSLKNLDPVHSNVWQAHRDGAAHRRVERLHQRLLDRGLAAVGQFD